MPNYHSLASLAIHAPCCSIYIFSLNGTLLLADNVCMHMPFCSFFFAFTAKESRKKGFVFFCLGLCLRGGGGGVGSRLLMFINVMFKPHSHS